MTNPQSASAHSELELDGIAYRRRGAPMIDGVSLLIAPGELVALLGPRDSGKTTLLNVIAGQIRQKSGHVRVDKVEVGRLPPKRRRIGIVAGYDALLPNRTVAQNVAHGIGSMWIKRRARSARVREVLDLVRAEGVADRYPRQLSIGQQQRVLIARALVMQPNILLLDEPFANLDRTARLDQQIELKRIQRSTGLTMVLATQDPEEALTLADRIALLNRGKLEQFASPSDIYDHPASLFASNFIGTANILSGKVVLAGGGQYTIGLGVGGTVLATSPVVLQVGTAVRVCLRPEALAITPHPDGLPATVELGWPLGACLMHELRLADGTGVKSASPRKVGDDPMPAGTEVRLRQQSLAIAFPEEST